MKSTTVFKNGPSTQAVRIPREYRLPTKEVWIEKRGSTLLIKPKPESWDDFFLNGDTVTDDFVTDREQRKPQNRKDFE